MLTRCVRRLAVTCAPPAHGVMTLPCVNAMNLRSFTAVSLVQHRAFSSDTVHPVVPNSRLWIGGLPYDSTHVDVRNRFERHGAIKKLEFPTTPDGRSNGTCYISFETPEAATRALAEHESVFGTRWIRVKLLRDLNNGGPRTPSNAKTTPSAKVFVGNLPYNYTEADVADLLSACGTVVHVNLVVDNENKSRGFGFALFETVEAAAAAIDLSGSVVQGRTLSINYSTRAPVRERGTAMADTVFVANLPQDVEEETLESMFDHCGAIDNIRLATDAATGRFRGFAHITFAMPEGAKNAVGLNGAQIDANTIGVELAISKSQKARRYNDKSGTAEDDSTPQGIY